MDDNAEITSVQTRSRNDVHSSNIVIATCTRNNNTRATSAEQTTGSESTDESDAEERILTVCCRAGRLGAASYTLQTGELQILEEIVDRPPEHQIFVSLFNQVDPVRVILDGKSQGTFVRAVKSVVLAPDSNDTSKCKLIFISSKEYNFEACKRRIHSLALPHEPANCTDEERVLFLRTVIDFSQTQTVHALGAMLRYLDLNWSNLVMDLHGKPQCLSLTRISLADIVAMDEDTYRGLQIFSSLSHPSGFKKGVQGSNKEGLSLYQLFSKCSSKVGHKRMRILLRHPTKDLETLRRRQAVVAHFMRPSSDSLMKNICASLRLIKNVNGILTKIKALTAKCYQWKSLYNSYPILIILFLLERAHFQGGPIVIMLGADDDILGKLKELFKLCRHICSNFGFCTLYNVVLICEMCEHVGRSVEYLEQLANYDTNKLYEMALYMNRIIDFDLTKSEGKFTVKAGVDRDLDLKKQTMASLQGLMSETAAVELERLPSFVQECSMLYMPHLGYLLAVRVWADHLTQQQKELPDMKFMFQNNDYIHYKSRGCEELDVMIGDTYPEIVAHETRIMMKLTATILENLHALAAAVDLCAELDCLITISKVCKEYNFVKPTLTTDKIINIEQGKHPLYITTIDNFVPNDIECSLEAGFVKILTGPNSSGKSVYMKQIGLIVYLAHIGSFVPAEAATIGIVDHIYSRIQSTECVAAHMSAFLIDLRQMALAIRESSSKSLLIVDEFGKGTAQTDGLALLAACVSSLLCREQRCPHLLLATHFLNIQDYIVESPIVRFLRFEHMVQDGEPVFLFRVVQGSSDSSFARAVAAASGVEEHVLRRAEDVLEAMTKNELPPPDKKIMAKLKAVTQAMKNTLLAEDI